MTPPKLSRRDLERLIVRMEEDYQRLVGNAKALAGAVAHMMHERGETVIDVTVPAWVYKQDCDVHARSQSVQARLAHSAPPSMTTSRLWSPATWPPLSKAIRTMERIAREYVAEPEEFPNRKARRKAVALARRGAR